MIIYLLLFLIIFAGCVGKGFVVGRAEAAMTASYEAASLAAYISRVQEDEQTGNIEEIAVVVEPRPNPPEYIEQVEYIEHAEQVQPEHAEQVQAVQAEIFQEFANFSLKSFNIDMGGYVMSSFADYAPNTAQVIAGHIAITFDDGPHPTLTPLLLDALDERGIQATFFLLGREVDRYPEIAARMYEAGHSIGNHSYRHPRFTTISRQRIVDEIESTNRSIEAATGSLPTLLRPPYGARNNTVLDVARQMDMSVVLWSVDPRDWDHRNAPLVSETILNYAVDGSVVLLHDIHETSIEAAIMAIDALMERGYAFVTVEQLFELSDLTLQAGEVYRSIYHSIGVSQ